MTKVSHMFAELDHNLSNKTAKELLTDFGLTNKEAEVYLFLAKYETLTGGEIAKQKKIARSLVYRILKSLQNKGLVEPTLETPTRFIAISLEKAIDLIIKTKQEEALQVQKLKKELLEDWKKVTQSKPKLNFEKFVVIEGSKKIYSKVLQMIIGTKKQFEGLLTLSTLAKADQFGLFEVLHNRFKNFEISYQLIINLTSEDLDNFEKINSRLIPEIKLNLKHSEIKTKMAPRVFIRDDEEILFFIRPDFGFSTDGQNEVCIFTNCRSLLQTFKSIFQNSLKSITNNEGLQKDVPSIFSKHELDRSEGMHLESASYRSEDEQITNQNSSNLGKLNFEKKLQKLNEDEEEIMEFASVAGNEFSFDLIEKVANYNRLKLLKKMDSLERKHQLITSIPTGYKFFHKEIREFIYTKLSPKLKNEYHNLFAEYFQTTGFSDENMKHLGYHLKELGRYKEAIIAYLKAANNAKNNWKIFEAINNYSTALKLMGNKKRWTNERINALESLGFLCNFSEDYDQANKSLKNAIKIAKDKIQIKSLKTKIYEQTIVRTIETNLSYFVYGTGKKTIVFIGASFHFIPQIFHFSKNYQVVYIDLLRFTDLKNPPSEYTISHYLDFLDAVISNLKNTTIYLVGVGLGGALSINFITKFPNKIAKLVLLATRVEKLNSEDELYRKQINNFWVNAFQNPSWGWDKIRNRITPSYFEWQKTAVPRSPDLFKIWNENPHLESIIMMKLIMEMDLESLLDKINVPTLILHGENDPISLNNVEKMSQQISESKIHIFKGVRLPTIFASEKFNGELEKFLS